MAGEFKIKTGLLLGAPTTQPVTSIKDTSISITSDASSLLVTGKAIFDYVSANSLLDGLTDVSIVDASDNDFLQWDATNSVWANVSPLEASTLFAFKTDVDASFLLYETKANLDVSFGNISLNNLSDVSITGVTDGSVLVYESTGGYWKYSAQTPGISLGSGGQIPYMTGTTDFTYDASFDRTINWSLWNETDIDLLTIRSAHTTGGLLFRYNDASNFMAVSPSSGSVSFSSLDGVAYLQVAGTNNQYQSKSHNFAYASAGSDFVYIRDQSSNVASNPYTFTVASPQDGAGIRYFTVKANGTILCPSINETPQSKSLFYNTGTGEITYDDPCTGTSIAWGSISGSISSQTDLYTPWLVDLSTGKFDKTGGTISGNVTIQDASLGIVGNLGVTGDVGIAGNLVVDGSIYSVGVETIDVSGAFMYLNTGFTGSPPNWMQSGVIIGRGSQDPYAILYDETLEQFRIGITPLDGSLYDDASTQAVATRQDTPAAKGIAFWNNLLFRFDTSSNFTTDGKDVSIGGKLYAGLSSSGQTNLVFYNSTTKELSYADASALGFDTSTFISLHDTPSSYSDGSAGAAVVMNDTMDGLEFASRIWREESNEVTLSNENANVLFYENIELEADAGLATLVDKDVTSSSAQGTEESYTFNLDGVTIAKIYGESDGAEGIQEEKLVSSVAFQAEASVYFTGIPDVSTSYVLFYDPTSDEVTYASQGSISGVTQLSALTDVSVASIGASQDGSTLVYESTGGYWTYGVGGGSGGGDYWTLDGSTLVPTDPTVDVKLGEIIIDTDAGAVTLVDMDVSSATIGTEESYAFNIDGSIVAKVYGKADGSGVLSETGFVVETAQYMGDPNTNGSWRFYPDSNGDLVFEKRISGSWTERGKFV